jgi:hypothetical protein
MANAMLVHGLWRTPVCMLSLGRRLKTAGHGARQFAYISVAESYERIVGRLAAQLSQLGAEGPYAAIGYSLGGVLLRAAIARVEGPPPVHLVMLGTPNRVPLLARRLSSFGAFHVALGESGSKLSQEAFYADLPVPAIPYTIIAGTRGPVGRLSPFVNEPNDGLVAVGETRVRDDDVPILVPVTHAFLPNARIVQTTVAEVLARAFSDAAPRHPLAAQVTSPAPRA